jgi:hypothetical protein
VATANAIVSEASAPNSGRAAIYWVVNKAGSTVWKGTVTLNGGGGDIELDRIDIVAVDVVQITSQTVTVPAGP